MQPKTKITPDIVKHIAILANIPIDEKESETLADGFTTVMKVVDTLSSVDTSRMEPVGHVTGLENVTRDDEVHEERMFSQEEALRNAPRTHNGYFVVDQIFDR